MTDLVQRFHSALPQVQEWIDQYLTAHAAAAQPVSSLGFKRLAACFPAVLLDSTKVVPVDRVPFPPVEKFGVPEFAGMQQIPFAGITFKDTFFVHKDERRSESLHFHEMVHVVQWARLGVDRFMLAYALGLAQFGYEESPLEAMAYTLQGQFDSGVDFLGLVGVIEQQTDGVWSGVEPLLGLTPP